MATRIFASEPADQGNERPLNVCIRPRNLDFVEYQGTRAQLEAEGIIPPGTQWPEGGALCVVEYWQARIHPESHPPRRHEGSDEALACGRLVEPALSTDGTP